MCGIFGTIGTLSETDAKIVAGRNALHGRDGYGVSTWRRDGVLREWRTPGKKYNNKEISDPFIKGNRSAEYFTALGNCRAEPTTEIVPNPLISDQQPYHMRRWAIVHNGVIANDAELIGEYLGDVRRTRIDSDVIVRMLNYYDESRASPERQLAKVVGELEGSWAIIARYEAEPLYLYFATNYRPLYFHMTQMASVLSSVPLDETSELIKPYTIGRVSVSGVEYTHIDSMYEPEPPPKSLVVLSGGLDSTAVAAMLQKQGHNVGLLHFSYGCRATNNELDAVQAVSAALDLPLQVVGMQDIFRQIGHSRLLDHSLNHIAGGEAGAEQAIEWVPARNTIMASIAVGIAEANGYDNVALGINLEESGGGYTDNVLDLYEHWNRYMHWVVGVNRRVQFIWPVGAMMKHEIVKAGLENGAPFKHTWSCYNAGEIHCGECGPCIMRRRAFEINGEVDPVKFAVEDVKI